MVWIASVYRRQVWTLPGDRAGQKRFSDGETAAVPLLKTHPYDLSLRNYLHNSNKDDEPEPP